MFLEECKYIVKERKILEYITEDIEISFDSNRKDSDEEISNEKILMKKSRYRTVEYNKVSF